jgi:hypothetical protein
LQALFQSTQHIYEKREGYGSGHLTNGSGSGRPKTSGSPTLPGGVGVLEVEAAGALAGQLGGEGRVNHRVATLLSRLHHQAGHQAKQLNLELGEKIISHLMLNIGT